MQGPDFVPLNRLLQSLNAGTLELSICEIASDSDFLDPEDMPDTTLIRDLRARIPGATAVAPSHPQRIQERQAGDRCLASLWRKLGARAKVNPSHLQISLSHSSGWAMCLGRITGENDTVLGIGVDVENKSRKIRPELKKKIISEPEESQAGVLDLLSFWVIKEACFKADPTNQGRMVSDYQVTYFDRSTSTGKAIRLNETLDFTFALYSDENWIVAFACSTNAPELPKGGDDLLVDRRSS